ncbi:unnamed protein product, partial [Brassica oleracea]
IELIQNGTNEGSLKASQRCPSCALIVKGETKLEDRHTVNASSGGILKLWTAFERESPCVLSARVDSVLSSLM